MLAQKITFDLMQNKLDDIRVVQGDSCREILFEGSDLDGVLSYDDYTYEFDLMKSDGTFVIQTLSAGILIPSEQMEVITGTHYYSVKIKDADNELVYSGQGAFIVDDNVITEDAIESVAEVNGLVFPDDFLTVEDHVAYIDDDTISTDSTWSSNKISDEIEAHTGGDVSKTVSGNPITFDDGASAPLVKCVTEIQGSQDLHGYDKPWVGGAGKNKLPMTVSAIKSANTGGTWSGNNYTVNGVTFSIITDNGDNVTGIKVNGTASDTAILIIGAYDVPAGTYTYNGCPSGGSLTTFYQDWRTESNVQRTDIGDGNTYTFPSASGERYARIIIVSGVTMSNFTFAPMIRVSTETADFSPYSNICPITAYTEGEIEVSGKNICGTLIEGYVLDYNTGLPTTNANYAITDFIEVKKDTTYTISNCSTGSENWFYDINKTPKSAIPKVPSSTTRTYTPTEDGYIRCSLSISSLNIFQIEKGSTATTYEPYTSTTHTTTYPSAIYRGSEDVVNGSVSAEWLVTDLGDISWVYDGTRFRGIVSVNLKQMAVRTLPFVCTCYQVITDGRPLANVPDGSCYNGTNENYIFIHDSRYNDADVFKAAVTGQKVAYPLQIPTTSSATPTNLPIRTLSGYNHIESSTGDMEVEYITAPYQPLIDSISQLI